MVDGQLKSEVDLRQLNNMSPTSAPNDLPESVRDLDLTRPGFKQAAMNLEDNEFSKLIKRDDLKCRTEDDVLMLIIDYIKKLTAKTFEDARKRYLPNVRLDQLSSNRLIALSQDRSGLIAGMEQTIIDALCVKLGGES